MCWSIISLRVKCSVSELLKDWLGIDTWWHIHGRLAAMRDLHTHVSWVVSFENSTTWRLCAIFLLNAVHFTMRISPGFNERKYTTKDQSSDALRFLLTPVTILLHYISIITNVRYATNINKYLQDSTILIYSIYIQFYERIWKKRTILNNILSGKANCNGHIQRHLILHDTTDG